MCIALRDCFRHITLGAFDLSWITWIQLSSNARGRTIWRKGPWIQFISIQFSYSRLELELDWIQNRELLWSARFCLLLGRRWTDESLNRNSRRNCECKFVFKEEKETTVGTRLAKGIEAGSRDLASCALPTRPQRLDTNVHEHTASKPFPDSNFTVDQSGHRSFRIGLGFFLSLLVLEKGVLKRKKNYPGGFVSLTSRYQVFFYLTTRPLSPLFLLPCFYWQSLRLLYLSKIDVSQCAQLLLQTPLNHREHRPEPIFTRAYNSSNGLYPVM